MDEIRLITLDPGHFHAALVQKEMYPGVARQVHVYAPLGPDLVAHLGRIAAFNTRRDHPTAWELEVHAGPDCVARMLRERPGNVVIVAGRNRVKLDYILAAIDAGLNVLADKPWIINAAGLPKLQRALDTAQAGGLVACDIMTERYEITSILQRELVNDPEVFGTPIAGTLDEPGVFMESVHYLLKAVAGVPLRRPAWFYDVSEQGDGLSDVGTHLVDLVPWILFPDQPIDAAQEVRVLDAKHWPTVLTREQFQQSTGEADFPEFLIPSLRDGALEYWCNALVSYTVRGIHVTLNARWGLQAEPGGGDTHFAVFRGSRARVEIRQGKEENFRPELHVVPNREGERGQIAAALRHRVQVLQASYPGVAVAAKGRDFWVMVPERYRTGHEAHFAEVTRQFLKYLQAPARMPAWEKPNMLAKYYVTSTGLALARQG
jgi:predicted dehydrogenase